MLYSQLLDPEACCKPRDYDTASELLKLQVFARQRPVISITLATDSVLFLSERCAGDASFLKLVREGYVRFPRWPQGLGPYESLARQLEHAPVFSDWPPELTSSETLRKSAIRCLRKGRTGHKAVDDMLEYARALFDAIENAEYAEEEPDRRPLFAARMKAIKAEYAQSIAQTALHTPVDYAKYAMGKYLPDNERQLGLRGQLYVWLKNMKLETPVHNVVKEIMDAEWNRVLAESLEYSKFQSAYRNIEDPRPALQGGPHQPCSIEQRTGADLEPTEFRSITWADICSSVTSSSLDAQKEIAKRYAERQIGRSQFLLCSGTVLVIITGSLCAWAVTSCGVALGVAAAAGGALNAYKELLKRKAEDHIAGYIAQL